jgi:hypothetical protein
LDKKFPLDEINIALVRRFQDKVDIIPVFYDINVDDICTKDPRMATLCQICGIRRENSYDFSIVSQITRQCQSLFRREVVYDLDGTVEIFIDTHYERPEQHLADRKGDQICLKIAARVSVPFSRLTLNEEEFLPGTEISKKVRVEMDQLPKYRDFRVTLDGNVHRRGTVVAQLSHSVKILVKSQDRKQDLSKLVRLNCRLSGKNKKFVVHNGEDRWLVKIYREENLHRAMVEYSVNCFRQHVMDGHIEMFLKTNQELRQLQNFREIFILEEIDPDSDFVCLFQQVIKIVYAIGHVSIETLPRKLIKGIQKEHIFDWVVSNHDSHQQNLIVTDNEIYGIDKEHIFDWVVSNHDSHQQNLIVTDNEIYGIDKEQSFKYFLGDSLDLNYNPNLDQYGIMSYYNLEFLRYQRNVNCERIDIDEEIS